MEGIDGPGISPNWLLNSGISGGSRVECMAISREDSRQMISFLRKFEKIKQKLDIYRYTRHQEIPLYTHSIHQHHLTSKVWENAHSPSYATNVAGKPRSSAMERNVQDDLQTGPCEIRLRSPSQGEQMGGWAQEVVHE